MIRIRLIGNAAAAVADGGEADGPENERSR
jgi:hypothetical protein